MSIIVVIIRRPLLQVENAFMVAIEVSIEFVIKEVNCVTLVAASRLN